MVDILQKTRNMVILVAVLHRTAKKCATIYNARAETLYCLLNPPYDNGKGNETTTTNRKRQYMLTYGL